MAAVAFDTLVFVEMLKESGIAEGQAKSISIAVRLAQESNAVATKRDLIEVKYDLLKWFIGVFLTHVALLIGILLKIMSLSGVY